MTATVVNNASCSTAIMKAIQVSLATAPISIAWPNHAFQVPEQTAWIRPIIKIPSTEVAELGDNGMGLRNGLLMIQIFDKISNGTKTANEWADRLEALFRRADIGNIWFDEPTSNPIGNDPNGYYGILMTVDFHYWVGQNT